MYVSYLHTQGPGLLGILHATAYKGSFVPDRNFGADCTVLDILDDISYGEYIDIALIILMGIIIPIIGVLLKNRPLSTWNQNPIENITEPQVNIT